MVLATFYIINEFHWDGSTQSGIMYIHLNQNRNLGVFPWWFPIQISSRCSQRVYSLWVWSHQVLVDSNSTFRRYYSSHSIFPRIYWQMGHHETLVPRFLLLCKWHFDMHKLVLGLFLHCYILFDQNGSLYVSPWWSSSLEISRCRHTQAWLWVGSQVLADGNSTFDRFSSMSIYPRNCRHCKRC